MIASILSVTFQENNIVATKGNLNNEIGVPLTVFRLNAQHKRPGGWIGNETIKVKSLY